MEFLNLVHALLHVRHVWCVLSTAALPWLRPHQRKPTGKAKPNPAKNSQAAERGKGLGAAHGSVEYCNSGNVAPSKSGDCFNARTRVSGKNAPCHSLVPDKYTLQKYLNETFKNIF